MRPLRYGRNVVLSLLLMAPAMLVAQSQATTGTIEGNTFDQTGAVLPGATVTIRNPATGVVRTVASDEKGYFRAPLLPPGSYQVTAELSGFARLQRTGLTLSIGQTVNISLKLQVAGGSETVTVSGEGPVVETTRTQISSTVNERAIAGLPVNGRNFIDFVLLTPGVTRDVRTGDISFAGQRGTLNSLVIDGADNNNTFFGQTLGRTGSGRAPYQFSQDAVKEFQVNSNGYSPEFGRAGGAVINVVTKSGENAFHGSGFWYYRDRSLNANDLINKINAREKSPYHFNQFGGDVSGPIKRDRAFFFFDYDGQRNTQPNLVFLNLPASIPSDADTQTGLQILQGKSQSWNRTQDQDVYLVKTDFQLNTNNRLSVRYNHQNFTGEGFENGGPQNSLEHTGASLVKTDTLNVAWHSILSPTFLNEFRFQYARDKEPGLANSSDPEVTVLQGGQTVLVIGRNFFSPRDTTIQRGQFADNISHLRGNHNLKIGVDLNIDRILNFFPGNFSGAYRFTSLAGFSRGRPTGPGERYVQAFPGEGTTGATTRPNILEFAVFFQDDWRVSRSLTLNFGARFDLQSFEQPSTKNPDPQLASNGIDTSVLNTDGNNVAPRVGFAWKPMPAGNRLVFRGGYGIFYGRTPSIMVGTAHSNNGLSVQTITFTGGIAPTWPNRLTSIPSGVALPKPTIFVFSPDYVNPYVQQGSFAAELGLTPETSFSATYLFVKGTHLQRSRDINVGVPAPTAIPVANEGTMFTYPRFPSARPYLNFDRIISFESTANSVYHGMTLELRRRFARHVQGQLSYTLGKVIDDVPDATAVVPQSSDDAKFAQNPANLRDDRSVGGNDQRHRLVASGLWDLAYAEKIGNPALKGILQGWSLSLIWTAQSGQPYSGLINTDLNNDGNNRNDRAPNLGRNTFVLPRTVTADLRISRQIEVRETMRLQLIFESFNLFNRANVTSVRNTLYSVSGGQLVRQTNFGSALGTSGPRILQFAAKLLF